jgi:diacylglycerol kinase family enzyme
MMSAAEYCIISNPEAGRRRAVARLARLRSRWEGRAEFWPTQHAGHAEELAYQAAQAGFRMVLAAGGDGTVHEVANGLLRAGRPDVVFGVLPIGSANDYAHSLACDGRPLQPGGLAVDVGQVSAASGRQRYFLCCLGLGLNGAVTLEAERIKRLQGLALYGLATLRALWRRYSCPVMNLTLDDDPPRSAPTLMLSLLLGRREGRFEMAPQAKLDDGLFEYIHAGGLSRLEILGLLPRLAFSGPPRDYPKVKQGQCRRLMLSSEAPLTVHIDGEFFSRPEDNLRDLKVRLLPRALTVQLFPAED